MNLKGKNGLVLGASRGIGLAIGRTLADCGVRLALIYHDWPESSARMIKEFTARQEGHLFLQVDLRSSEAVEEMAQRLAGEFGSLEVLINNIERGGMPAVHGAYTRPVNRDQWQLEMDTTLHAKHLVFNSCLPLLQRADKAAVVNISSIAAITGRSGPAGLVFSDGYSAANRGVAALTRTWARLGAPSVRVNELMLGLIDSRHGRGTRGWNEALSKAQKQALLDHTLVGRTGTPEEVARAVLFLVEADFMTGATLRLDGGFVLGGEQVPPIPDGII